LSKNEENKQILCFACFWPEKFEMDCNADFAIEFISGFCPEAG
jgi:hypothetical protein